MLSRRNVIHRTQGADFGDSAHDSTVRRQIADAESLRVKVVVSGTIETARVIIVAQQFISDDMLLHVLRHTQFIPSELFLITRGFTRFFQADFVAATYILVPLLDNSLRRDGGARISLAILHDGAAEVVPPGLSLALSEIFD